MKRITCSIAAAGLVCLLAWLSGFDFNERGGTALLVAYLTLVTGGATYFFPGWTE